MRLLDLFCGAGGAAMGYLEAGFTHITGIDINPQPNYPFEFIQADLTTDNPVDPTMFDLIHASPPCQAHSTLRHSPGGRQYADLIETTRQILFEYDRPYVIENVPGAPLHNPVQICGSSVGERLDGFELRRHRLFECSFPVLVPPCQHDSGRQVLGVYGDLSRNQRPSNRGVKAGLEQAAQLMGIDWMTGKELSQAIPPAYTKLIGEQFIRQSALSF